MDYYAKDNKGEVSTFGFVFWNFSHFVFVISLLRSLDRLLFGDLRNELAEILFQSFLWEDIVSSSVMGRDVHSLILSNSISSTNHGATYPPRCPEGCFLSAVMEHGIICLVLKEHSSSQTPSSDREGKLNKRRKYLRRGRKLSWWGVDKNWRNKGFVEVMCSENHCFLSRFRGIVQGCSILLYPELCPPKSQANNACPYPLLNM